jgi:GT2 family glycosyltransferase
LRREIAIRGILSYADIPVPPAVVLVHGPAPADPAAFAARIRGGTVTPADVYWAAGPAPAGCTAVDDWTQQARALTEIRADRYVVFLDTRAELEAEWLADLIDAVEFGSDVAAAGIGEPGAVAPYALNACATIALLSRFPQDVRIEAASSPDAALACWTEAVVARGRALRLTPRAGRVPAWIAPDPLRLEELSTPAAEWRPFASIVMLSWNAPEYTEIAMRSIRANTRPGTYEVIIIDNGSGPETLERLAKLDDVRIIYNPVNRGFAGGCNQGIAAARGTHVVLLNNDVFVTDGWLDRLLDAQRRNPCAGVTAPRSNNVAGDQRLITVPYSSEEGLIEYAAQRARDWDRRSYHTDRAIGFCLCIDRRVIDEIGGIDTRYGIGNFEDDDYCIRVRAAGYEILVCEDVLIHHFGSVSFRANNVNYTDQMHRNWQLFAERWGFPRAYPENGYYGAAAIARGYDRSKHYGPLPELEADGTARAPEPSEQPAAPGKGLALVALVEREADWNAVGAVANNYLRALRAADDALFAIAVRGELDAETIGTRLRKTLEKLGISDADAADVLVEDVDDVAAWLPGLGARLVAVRAHDALAALSPLEERSPSALVRLVRSGVPEGSRT